LGKLTVQSVSLGFVNSANTNIDRTIRKQNILQKASGEAIPDWKIFMLIAHKLGFKDNFNYHTPENIFNEYKEMTKLNNYMDISKIDYKPLENKSFRWGNTITYFLTKDSKANLYFVENKLLSEKSSLDYPFILLTGRTRDQWHTGTKTLNVNNLLKYKELNFCEINIFDAQKLNIINGDNIKVISKRGELYTKALVTKNIRKKTIFIPISNKKINYLTNDLFDRFSLQPDYNHSAVKIEKII